MRRRYVKQAVHGSIIVMALALAGCQTLSYVDFNQATDAEKAGDHGKAALLYHSVANSDNSEVRQTAQFRLAEMYLEGLGVKKNPQTALRLFKDVTNGPDQTWRSHANFQLGTLYENGVPGHIKINRPVAASYYKEAADGGSAPAANFLKWISEYPDVYVSLNETEFRHQGSEQAPAGMALAYKAFNAGDHKGAFPIFLWHAKNGSAEAQAAVAVFYKDGLSVTSDPQRYAGWTYLAARNGNRRAQLELGELYMNGGVVPASGAGAQRWLQAAAKQGEIEAINWLGVILVHPIDQGQKPDALAAVRLFQQAADAGSSNAMTNLGDVSLLSG
jgi:TPR repeat protein